MRGSSSQWMQRRKITFNGKQPKPIIYINKHIQRVHSEQKYVNIGCQTAG